MGFERSLEGLQEVESSLENLESDAEQILEVFMEKLSSLLNLTSPSFPKSNDKNSNKIFYDKNNFRTSNKLHTIADSLSEAIENLKLLIDEKRDELAITFGTDNKIYAIGGFGGTSNACLKSAERYNIKLD